MDKATTDSYKEMTARRMCLWPTALCVAICLLLLPSPASSWPDGAPSSVCASQYPIHSHLASQLSEPPYTLTVSPPYYRPGDTIEVTIMGIEGRKFKGFALTARTGSGISEQLVGRFLPVDNDKVQIKNCAEGESKMATHTNPEQVTSVTVNWEAPTENIGDVVIRAAVVENYVTFWADIRTPLFSVQGSVTMDEQPSTVTGTMADIDFDECGYTKGCFLYPRTCSDSDCIAAVTYRYRADTNDVQFELHTSTADRYNWVAVGFSDDKKMGQDETYSCVSNNGVMSVQQGYNPGYYNERLLTRFITEAELKQEGSTLQCRFTVPVTTTIYQVEEEGEAGPEYSSIPFDLDSDWYLLLAWGPTTGVSDLMAFHPEMPAVSDNKVNIHENDLVRGSSYRAFVHTHAVLMIVAWLFLASISTLMARHYKDWLSERLFCGVKAWFQVHRTLAFLILLLTGLGLVFIFTQYDWEIRSAASTHAGVGIAVTVALCVQVLMGILRPGHSHRFRTAFNWAHGMLGRATFILAVVNMFLAFNISHITKESQDFGFLVLIIFLAAQAVWYMGYEVLRCRKEDPEDPETVSLRWAAEADSSEKPTSRPSKARDDLYSVLLVLYLISMLGLCVAAILAFVLY